MIVALKLDLSGMVDEADQAKNEIFENEKRFKRVMNEIQTDDYLILDTRTASDRFSCEFET
jgi:hypothetical protein